MQFFTLLISFWLRFLRYIAFCFSEFVEHSFDQWILKNPKHDHSLSVKHLGAATPRVPVPLVHRVLLYLRYIARIPLAALLWRLSNGFSMIAILLTSAPIFSLILSMSPFPSSGFISNAWLEDTLRKKGLIGGWVQIRKIVLERLPNSSFGVIQYRIHIEYGDSTKAEKLPRTLTFRQNHLSLYYRVRQISARWYRECHIFRNWNLDNEFFPADKFEKNAGILPGVVWCFAWPWGDYICILQDLEEESSVHSYKSIIGKYRGVYNYTKGEKGDKTEKGDNEFSFAKSLLFDRPSSGLTVSSSFSDMHSIDSMSEDQSKSGDISKSSKQRIRSPKVNLYSIENGLIKRYSLAEVALFGVRDLARLHGAFWRSPDLMNAPFDLRGCQFYNGLGYYRWTAELCALRRQWIELKKNNQMRVVKGEPNMRLPQELSDYIDETLSLATWDSFISHIKQKPYTMLYGNSNPLNMYFTTDGSSPHLKLASWHDAGVGEPTLDLVGYLCWLPMNVLKEFSESFLDEYLTVLRSFNVKEYTKPKLLEDIKPRVDCLIADLIVDGGRYIWESNRRLKIVQEKIVALHNWKRLFQSIHNNTVITNIVMMH